MGTITIGVDNETERKFRQTVSRVVGSNKGSLGKAVREAMEKWVSDKEQTEIRQRALKRLASGYSIGKLRYTHRSELHER